MAVNMTLPRAMLIDMDDTILSAYGRPEIAWNHVAAEFADELAPLPPQQVAAEVLSFARKFWSTAEAGVAAETRGGAAPGRCKGGFDALAAAGHAAASRRSRDPDRRPLYGLSRGRDVRVSRRA